MSDVVQQLLALLETPDADELSAAGDRLKELPASETFKLCDRLAEREDPILQTALSAWLHRAGLRDPEGLSVFLAANAHTLPVSTITAAGKALPEVG